MKVTKLSPYCIEVDIEFKAGETKSFMLSADHHWDNPKCDRELLKKDLDRAVKDDMGIFSFGDLFCAMQGKGDRRSSKSDIRPEHNEGNYLDLLTDTATEWYAPYAKNILMLSDGNHETGVKKHKEVDLTRRLCEGLYYKSGHRPVAMTYAGWVLLRFKRNGKVISTMRLAYHHGHGGGGIVTKGTLWPARRAAQLPDADVFVSGHIHEKWIFPIMRQRISNKGIAYVQEQTHIQTPTYKEEYLSHKAWHVETGKPPKPLGCWFMHCKMGNYKHPASGNSQQGVLLDFEQSVRNTIY